MSELHCILKPDNAKLDVVFIHGLAGHQFTTWQHDEDKPEDSWPYWVANARQDIAVHSLQYEADRSNWIGHAMPLQDRAKGVLTTLQLEKLGERPIIFVCHSLGGLLAKQLLRTAKDTAKPEWQAILDQTRDVFFLATPHAGSVIATWLDNLGKIYDASAAIKDLKKNAPNLRDLNTWYRENSKRLKIDTHAFYETQEIGGIRIVGEGEAHPGIESVIAIPIDADHLSIVKPDHHDEIVCRYLLDQIDQLLETSAAGGTVVVKQDQRNSDASDEDLARIREALENGKSMVAGIGGIAGKQFADRLQDENLFPDGVQYVDLKGPWDSDGPLSTREALKKLLRLIFGQETKLPDDEQSLRQLWKQETANLRMLLFLDNARDASQIRPLLPNHSGCKVVATSSNRLDLDDLEPINIDTPPPAEEKSLLIPSTSGNNRAKSA